VAQQVLSLDTSSVRWDKRGPSNPPPVPQGSKTQKRLFLRHTIGTGTQIFTTDDIKKAIYEQYYFMTAPTTAAMDFSYSIIRCKFWGAPNSTNLEMIVNNYFDGTSAADSGTTTSCPYAGFRVPSSLQFVFDSSETTAYNLYSIYFGGASAIAVVTVSIKSGNTVPIGEFLSFARKQPRKRKTEDIADMYDELEIRGDEYGSNEVLPKKPSKRGLFKSSGR
jgi:hypothetical protein